MSDPTPWLQWQCYFCGHVYDEAQGRPEHGIAAHTRFADLPTDWVCPDCGAPKADFQRVDPVSHG